MIDPETFLASMSALADEEIELSRTALILAAVENKSLSIERYENHLKKLCDEVAAEHAALLKNDAADTAITQLQALKNIIVDKNEYKGDTQTYDDLDNANLIRVIDRRKGLPITLAIIYLHVAQAIKWSADGLDFPGHFLCRLQKDGQRLIFDPFNDAAILEAADLRALVKKVKGPGAELDAAYFEAASNRSMLLRLQNNIKYRLIEAEDYINALKIVETMQKIHPGEFRLLLDAGVLYARTGQPMAAIAALNDYINHMPAGRDRAEAERLLSDIRQTLN